MENNIVYPKYSDYIDEYEFNKIQNLKPSEFELYMKWDLLDLIQNYPYDNEQYQSVLNNDYKDIWNKYLNQYDEEKINLMSLESKNLDELINLARIFKYRDKYKMIYCYNKCIEKKYKVGICYFELAEYYKINNDYDEMIKNYLLAIDNNHYESILKISKYYLDNKNYDMMKKYLNFGIEKKDLNSMLFMALFYRFVEKNLDEEIKYYLMILKEKYLINYDNISCNDGTSKYYENINDGDLLQYYWDTFSPVIIESLYFLSLCYKTNNGYDNYERILRELINEIEDYVINGGDFQFDLSTSYAYFNFKICENNVDEYIYLNSLKELGNKYCNKSGYFGYKHYICQDIDESYKSFCDWKEN
jgi:hypothetical protein